MHRSECLAKGGFKINKGPPKNGKGPMSNEKEQDTSTEASPSRPTQAGRIELCQEAIKEAMKCLSNGNRECVVRLIEGLIKNQCHNGNAVGKEVADRVRDVVHEVWLRNKDYGFRCGLLRMLRDLGGISKKWITNVLRIPTRVLNKWLARCNIKWITKRNSIIEYVESLLRDRFGWSEVRMCEELWRFVGVDVDEFRKYGIEPCDWVHAGFDEVYFMGIALTDLGSSKITLKNIEYIIVLLNTTNTIDAIFFLLLLQPIRRPGIIISWNRGTVEVRYFVLVKVNKWEWVSHEKLVSRVRALRPEDVPRLIGGAVDGDGSVHYNFSNHTPSIIIAACKACRKRVFLNVLQEALEKIGIEGKIYETDDSARLEVYGENAIKLLRLIMPYLRHPLRRLRAKLILMLYEGKIDYETFTKLYEQTKYEDKDDPKRKHALEALARAAPQTHTHGVTKHLPNSN